MNAQVVSKISYKVEYLRYSVDTTNVEPDVLSFLIKDENESKRFLNSQNALFELFFDKNQSLFISIELLNRDDDLIPVSLKSKVSEYVYSSSSNNLYSKNHSKFVKIETPVYNWEIKDDFKTILGYKCQKAVIYNYSKSKPIITAWFTENIPLPYGPSNFFGTPGIILELNRYDRVIYATDIENTNFMDMNELFKEKKLTIN